MDLKTALDKVNKLHRSSSEKLFLLQLIVWDGAVEGTAKEIAATTGLTARTIQRTTVILEAAGHITKVNQSAPNGWQKANQYYLAGDLLKWFKGAGHWEELPKANRCTG